MHVVINAKIIPWTYLWLLCPRMKSGRPLTDRQSMGAMAQADPGRKARAVTTMTPLSPQLREACGARVPRRLVQIRQTTSLHRRSGGHLVRLLRRMHGDRQLQICPFVQISVRVRPDPHSLCYIVSLTLILLTISSPFHGSISFITDYRFHVHYYKFPVLLGYYRVCRYKERLDQLLLMTM